MSDFAIALGKRPVRIALVSLNSYNRRMAVTREQARAAKERLVARLEGAGWLRGIGVARSLGEYIVKVNVSEITDEVNRRVPSMVGEVRVLTVEMGDISAPPPGPMPRCRPLANDAVLRKELLANVKKRSHTHE